MRVAGAAAARPSCRLDPLQSPARRGAFPWPGGGGRRRGGLLRTLRAAGQRCRPAGSPQHCPSPHAASRPAERWRRRHRPPLAPPPPPQTRSPAPQCACGRRETLRWIASLQTAEDCSGGAGWGGGKRACRSRDPDRPSLPAGPRRAPPVRQRRPSCNDSGDSPQPC